MVSAESIRDTYTVRADLSPHRLDCTVIGPDGRRMYVGRTEPYEHITEIRLYEDEAMRIEALVIRSRRNLDVSEVYDVWDSKAGVRVGAIRRMRHRSLRRDEWTMIGDEHHCSPGVRSLDCGKYAVLKRALCGIHEHRFHTYVGGRLVGTIRDRRDARGRYYIETIIPADIKDVPDRRLSVAASVLLLMLDSEL